MIGRAIIGVALAAGVSVAARRTRSLSRGGAVAATIVGSAAVAAGWTWGVLLITYFVTATLLSHAGRRQKESRTAAIIAKGGERDAVQVLANGAMFAGAALAMVVRPDARWIGLAAGSLAAAASDTWATEIGTLFGREPRSILSWNRVPAGTSGAISMLGTLGAVAGAVLVAGIVFALGWTFAIAARVALAGVVGSTIDSILGATLQVRQRCDACGMETERATHVCGATTHVTRGLRWMDNDMVNFLSNASGGLLAAWLSR